MVQTKKTTTKTVVTHDKTNKTYSAKPSEVKRSWLLVDASEAPLGRISTQIATYLTGKHKPMYTAHIDCGDYVVVINAAKVPVTGDKLEAKKYYHYSGYPSGIKETPLKDQLAKDPTKVIQMAVKGMLPRNKLANERLKRLKIFAGEAHDHQPQQPRKVYLPKTSDKPATSKRNIQKVSGLEVVASTTNGVLAGKGQKETT